MPAGTHGRYAAAAIGKVAGAQRCLRGDWQVQVPLAHALDVDGGRRASGCR